jgi:hypothetical protein
VNLSRQNHFVLPDLVSPTLGLYLIFFAIFRVSGQGLETCVVKAKKDFITQDACDGAADLSTQADE